MRRGSILKKRIPRIALPLLCILILAGGIVAYVVLRDDRTTIKVSGAYALYPMMTIWAREYRDMDPSVRIEVSGGGAGKGMTDVLAGLVDIGMVSREIYPEEIRKGAIPVSVCMDAVVPTVSSDNPVLGILKERGITREDLESVFVKRTIRTWGDLVGDPSISDRINVYSRADACGAASVWAQYLGNHTQDDLSAACDTAIMHDPDMARAVSQDRLGIGYNNLNFAYDLKDGDPVPGLQVLPLDIDGNGILDPDEDFYGNRDGVVEAISGSGFPAPPARPLYLVAKGSFEGKALEFVNWILTDGQSLVGSGGYVQLSEETIDLQIATLKGEGAIT